MIALKIQNFPTKIMKPKDETRPEDENEVVVPENKEIDEKEVKSASNDTETDAPNITTNPPQEQEDEKPLLENGDSDEDDDDEENGEQQNNGITGNGDASVDKNIDDEPGFDFNEEENSDETATTQSKLTDSERIIESEKLAAEQ